MMHDAKIAGSEDYVAYKSRDNNVKIIQETAIGKVLENALTAQSTEESKARVKKMAEDITVNYMNAYTNKRNASTQELQQMNSDRRKKIETDLKKELGERQLDQQETQMYINTIMGILEMRGSTTIERGYSEQFGETYKKTERD